MRLDLKSLKLGERLRRVRTKLGLSPEGVAQAAGIAVAQFTAFESETQVPDLAQLLRLADALQTSPCALLAAPGGAGRVEFVRVNDRWKVQPSTDQATYGNYRYEALSYRLTEKLMSPFLIELSPQHGGEMPMSSHDGEEFLFLLSGEVTVTIEDHKYAMRAGDSLYFDSRLQHSILQVGPLAARLIACIAQDHKEPPGNPIERAYGES